MKYLIAIILMVSLLNINIISNDEKKEVEVQTKGEETIVLDTHINKKQNK